MKLLYAYCGEAPFVRFRLVLTRIGTLPEPKTAFNTRQRRGVILNIVSV